MKKKSFTLVEIMIVVAIITLLAAIAIPSFLRMRLNANESAAVAALHTIATAAQSYRSVNATYPANLADLGVNSDPSYIDTILGCSSQPCTKQGYNFTLTGTTYTFTATAVPVTFQRTGIRSFYIDESNIIRYCTTENCNPKNGSILE